MVKQLKQTKKNWHDEWNACPCKVMLTLKKKKKNQMKFANFIQKKKRIKKKKQNKK